MIRFDLALLVGFCFLLIPFSSHGKPIPRTLPGDYVIDFSPIKNAKGSLDCKLKFISKTVKGDSFQRGIQLKGPVAEHTVEDVLQIVKRLYEFEKWQVKEVDKTKLLVLGKSESSLVVMEIEAEGLAKEYLPTVSIPPKK